MLSSTSASDGVVDPAARVSVNLAEIQRSPSGRAVLATGLIHSRFGKKTKYALPDARWPRAGIWTTSYPSPLGNENSPRPRIVPGVPPNRRAPVKASVDCADSDRVFLAA